MSQLHIDYILRLWYSIKARCYNENFKGFHNYGGKGVIMCNEWLTDFNAFYEWGIENGWQKGLDIDRIDNNGDYEPGNCRFVDRKTNCRNKNNNLKITIGIETKTLKEWCEIYNMEYQLVHCRIHRYKWDALTALTYRIINKSKLYSKGVKKILPNLITTKTQEK